MYDSRIGRWFATDPMEDRIPSVSTYAYVANNPLYYVDPDGEFMLDVHQRIMTNATKAFLINNVDYKKFNFSFKNIRRRNANIGFNKGFMYGLVGNTSVCSGGITYPDINMSDNKKAHFDSMNYDQIMTNFDKIYKETENLIEKYKDYYGMDAPKGSNHYSTGLAIGKEVGIKLHAIEDFYSHSNYVEIYEKIYGQTDVNIIPTLEEVINNKKYESFNEALKTDLKTGEYPGTGEGSHREMNHDVGAGTRYHFMKEVRGRKVTWNSRAAEAVATRASSQYLGDVKSKIEESK